MTKEQLLKLLKTKKRTEIDLAGVDLEGVKTNLRHVDKNEIIFRSGDNATSIYFIVNGEVMLTNGNEVRTVGEKEYFGLDAINPNVKQDSKAISIKQGIILEIILQEVARLKNKKKTSKLSINRSSKKSHSDFSFVPNMDDKDLFINEEHNDIVAVTVKIKKAILTHSKSFLNHMNKLIKSGQRKIIVDLTYSEIIDSTFLGILVKTLKTISKEGGEIVLIYDQSQSSTLFMITYMDKVFKIFDNKEKAYSYFESKS